MVSASCGPHEKTFELIKQFTVKQLLDTPPERTTYLRSPGSVVPNAFGPGIRIAVEAPASPLAWFVSTLGTLPASAWTTLDTLARWTSAAVTLDTLLPNRSRNCSVPAPVTTISSSRSGSDTSWKSCASVPPGVSVTVNDCPQIGRAHV